MTRAARIRQHRFFGLVTACIGALACWSQPAAPDDVDPTGTYFGPHEGSRIEIRAAQGPHSGNYRVDLFRTARPGGLIEAGQPCSVAAVGSLRGSKLVASTDVDEDVDGELREEHLQYGGIIIQLFGPSGNTARVRDTHVHPPVCGAPFSGTYRRHRGGGA